MSRYYFLFFVAAGMMGPYLNLHFYRLGVTPTQLGLMTGTATVIGFFLQPVWGFLADRSGSRPRFLGAMLVIAGLWALVVGQLTTVTLVMLGGIILTLVQHPATPIADSIALAESAQTGVHFSRIRLWGAVGWIVSTGLSGWIYDRTGNHLMFWFYALGILACAYWAWRLPDPGVVAGAHLKLRSAIKALGSNGRLAAVLLTACVVQGGYSLHMLFMPIYLSQQGAPEGYVGLAFSVGALTEVPVFLGIAHVARRTGPIPLLVTALIIQGLLYGLMAQSPAPNLMLLINALSGIYFATYYPTLVTLVGSLTPESLRSTAQGLLNSFTWGLGSMVGTVVGGRVVDMMGIAALYKYLILTASVGMVGYLGLGVAMRRRAPTTLVE